MSLEGLDSAHLWEVFETAQAEPGGWYVIVPALGEGGESR
jgi:hypothetical protein